METILLTEKVTLAEVELGVGTTINGVPAVLAVRINSVVVDKVAVTPVPAPAAIISPLRPAAISAAVAEAEEVY